LSGKLPFPSAVRSAIVCGDSAAIRDELGCGRTDSKRRDGTMSNLIRLLTYGAIAVVLAACGGGQTIEAPATDQVTVSGTV